MRPARAAAVSRVRAARRAHDQALQALSRLSEPSAFLALSAVFSDLAAVRPVLERHVERCCDEHVAAVRDLGRHLSQPVSAEAIS